MTQWANCVYAFFYRNFLFAVRNVFAFAELIFWPVVTLISIGLMGDYLSLGEKALAFILTGAISSGVIQVTQLDVCYGLLYEVWSKSMKHTFLTPVSMSAYLIGSWLNGIIRGSFIYVILSLAAVALFGFPVPGLLMTLIYLLGLFGCSFLLGLFVNILVLIFGQKAEITAWMMTYLFMLVCGIYYPIDTLPDFFYIIAQWIPMTYFLEYVRLSFGFEPILSQPLGKGFGLIAFYTIVGFWLTQMALGQARKKGIIVRLSE